MVEGIVIFLVVLDWIYIDTAFQFALEGVGDVAVDCTVVRT